MTDNKEVKKQLDTKKSMHFQCEHQCGIKMAAISTTSTAQSSALVAPQIPSGAYGMIDTLTYLQYSFRQFDQIRISSIDSRT